VSYSLDLLDSIKYESEEEIKSFVEVMALKFRDRKDELLEAVSGNSIFSINKDNEDRALKAIFLSLALTTITSNLYNPYLRKELIRKFQNVSEVLGIPYSDIVGLTKEEPRLRTTILSLPPSS
jgi:hypothetical protein